MSKEDLLRRDKSHLAALGLQVTDIKGWIAEVKTVAKEQEQTLTTEELLRVTLERHHTEILNSGNASKCYTDHWNVYEYRQYMEACTSLGLQHETAHQAWDKYYADSNLHNDSCKVLTVFTDPSRLTAKDQEFLRTGKLIHGGLYYSDDKEKLETGSSI